MADTTDAPEPPPADRRAATGPMNQREVVMVLTHEQADEFGRQIRRLEAHYETTGVAATVLATIAEAISIADRSPA